jgi:hypothetical protein
MTSILKVDSIQNSAGTAAMTIDSSGNISEPNKEYFRVKLTSAQTGNSDNAIAIVNFASNGTVVYDTLSNWDASTNSYQLGSSDGVYLIHFSLGIASPTTTTETLRDTASLVEFTSNNFSSLLDTPAFGFGSRYVDQDSADYGAVTMSNSSVFKATATGIKIRLSGYANTDATAFTIAKDAQATTGSQTATGLVPADVTFLEVVRIA